MRPFLVGAAALVAAVGLMPAAAAHDDYISDGAATDAHGAHDGHQHGETDGHLPASHTDNIKVVSKTRLKNVVPGKIADVGVHEGFAYLAAWGGETCKYNGIHVVDIRDVKDPREVAFIPSKEGSAPGEGVQAVHIDTPYFDGDVLVSNNEKCKEKAGFGGMNIYDVTKPRHPTPLAVGVGDFTVNGQGKKAANDIHSVFAWDAGATAYAVIVDNEESDDVDIVDITDPKKARVVAEYDLAELFPQIVEEQPANLTDVFSHDMVVKEINGRQIMLMSYWDGGYVTLDVTDVRNPVYIGDSDFGLVDPETAGLDDGFGNPLPPEGNAHQAEFTIDNRYIVASDEDFDPIVAASTNVDDGTALGAPVGSDTPALPPGELLEGRTVFVGRACPGDAAVPAGDATSVDVAVVERGVCTFTEKVASVDAAGGYDAVLIFNREGADACVDSFGMLVEGNLPTFGVTPRVDGYELFDIEDQFDEAACLAGDGSALAPIDIGTVGDRVRFSSYFDGWGYVHLYRNNAGKLSSLDTYAIPEAHDPDYAQGFGDLTGHEVAVSEMVSNRLYFSYYAAGFRVAEIQNGQIVEKGHYIADKGNNFWGVQVFEQGGKEYVAASDRDSGLWIFHYQG